MSVQSISRFCHFTKRFSATSTSSSSAWRIQAQQCQLVSQISSILLQRHNWSSLLSTLNLSHNLTPPIFLQILDKIQTNPEISLNFFNWAKSNLGFKPDLKTHCKVIRILIGSGDTRPINPVLDYFIGVDPPTTVVYSMVQACKGTHLHPLAFSFIIEAYAQKGLYFDGLVVYRKITSYGYLPKVSCLNRVLEVLECSGEYKLAYCLYGSMCRSGILPDMSTWTIMSRIFCKNGKFERVVRLLDMGICNYEIFNLVIDYYSKVGNLGGAIDQVNVMCKRHLEPGFDTYGSILDKACEFGNGNVIDSVMCVMKEKKMVPDNMHSGYDNAIRKFCDLGKTYAAEFMFNRARDEKDVLEDATFGCMLRAFCKGGRVDEAIRLYFLISNEKIKVKKSCYQKLVDRLCEGNPSGDVYQLLVDLIHRGFIPGVSEISKFILKLGKKDRWQEAEDLLNVMPQAGFLPDSGCCRSWVKHYCSLGQIDSAQWLHDKLEPSWDVTTYNVLLRALFVEKRIDEALNIFNCMRTKNAVNRATFLVMISGLSQVGEIRHAMQVHDEMLERGLKPSSKTYKSLISVFR